MNKWMFGMVNGSVDRRCMDGNEWGWVGGWTNIDRQNYRQTVVWLIACLGVFVGRICRPFCI